VNLLKIEKLFKNNIFQSFGSASENNCFYMEIFRYLTYNIRLYFPVFSTNSIIGNEEEPKFSG